MKKMMMLGLMALSASAVQAHESVAAKAEVQHVAHDEQAFVANLSEHNRTTFSHMTAEQKHAVLAAAKDAPSADAAVEKVAAEKK